MAASGNKLPCIIAARLIVCQRATYPADAPPMPYLTAWARKNGCAAEAEAQTAIASAKNQDASIHASCAGGDALRSQIRVKMQAFQSTPPVWEATAKYSHKCPVNHNIWECFVNWGEKERAFRPQQLLEQLFSGANRAGFSGVLRLRTARVSVLPLDHRISWRHNVQCGWHSDFPDCRSLCCPLPRP